MAIEKLTSNELNNILTNATAKLDNMSTSITTIKSDLNKKLMIMKHEVEYISSKFTDLSNGAYTQDTNMKIFSKDGKGQYEIYGSTVHPKFVTTPWNVYNLKIAGTGDVYFRTDVKVQINGVDDPEYTSVLKHDSVSDKSIFFQEFNTNTITLDILPDLNNKLGGNKFNVLELDSFLYGSYDITKVSIYGFDNTGAIATTPIKELGHMSAVGKQRIVLPEKIEFSKISIQITLKYSTNDNNRVVYPFGLKHIYLYDADFINESYVVATIYKNKHIATVGETVIIKTPFGNETTSFTLKNITAYTDINIMDDSTKIITSTDNDVNELAKNVNIIYIKVPIVKESLIGANFNIGTR